MEGDSRRPSEVKAFSRGSQHSSRVVGPMTFYDIS